MEKVRIIKDKNEVILSFNNKFYNKEVIDKAIEDFKQACDVRQEGELIILKPKEKTDLNILGYEFYNYVLGLIKNN